MKTSNVEGHGSKATDATRGRRSGLVAGSKGMTWRDDATESAGQVREMTVIGATFIDNDDGTGVLIIGDGTGGGPDDIPDEVLTEEEAADLYVTNTYGGYVPQVITAGSAETIDLAAANVFYITLTDDLTLTFSNPPASGSEGRWRFFFKQGGSGSYTVAWPAEVVFRDTDGTQITTGPDLATAIDAGDTFEVTTLDGGATYGASLENGSNGATAAAATERRILLADGHATPFVFTDLLQMDDGSDFMWSD